VRSEQLTATQEALLDELTRYANRLQSPLPTAFLPFSNRRQPLLYRLGGSFRAIRSQRAIAELKEIRDVP
jgi:hypothetical protein